MANIDNSTVLTLPLTSRQWMNQLLCEKNRLQNLRPFQLDHALDLFEGRDLFLVIATGMGKTTVLHAPLQAAQALGKIGIAFLIVPTKVLAEQQVCDVANNHSLY